MTEELFLFLQRYYDVHINQLEEARQQIELDYSGKKLSPEAKTIKDILHLIINLSINMAETTIFFCDISERLGIKNIELTERLEAVTKYFGEHEVELKDFMNKELEKNKNEILSEEDKKVLAWIKKYFEHNKGEDPDQ